MKIEQMKIKDIIPYERNAKKHDNNQINNVAESIQRFGFAQPLVVDKDNVLIIGHCRLLAAKRLKMREVPVVKMTELTEDQVKQLRLLDNKLNESEWDLDLLMSEIEGLDFEGFNIDWEIPELEETLEVIEDEAPEPELEKEPITKPGDIYKLGRHRLICGDSTNPETIQKLLDGEKTDLLITDPPYNVALGQNKGHTLRPSEAKQLHRRTDGLVIANDRWESGEAFRHFLSDAFAAANTGLKQGGAFYIWYASSESYNFIGAANDIGWTIREQLIWVKNILVLGRQDYHWQHEPCLYGWKDGAPHYFIDDRTQTTIWEAEDFNPEKMKKEELLALVKEITKQPSTIIREDKPSRSAEHPTMKPVKLIARLVRNSSRQGERVLDVFGGSGSTMMACEQLGRECYMVELDPHYCDVIVKRWENFTGKKAERINGL